MSHSLLVAIAIGVIGVRATRQIALHREFRDSLPTLTSTRVQERTHAVTREADLRKLIYCYNMFLYVTAVLLFSLTWLY